MLYIFINLLSSFKEAVIDAIHPNYVANYLLFAITVTCAKSIFYSLGRFAR